MDYIILELYCRVREAELNQMFAEERGIDYGETLEAV